MKLNLKVYIGISAIVGMATIATYLLPVNEIGKIILASPIALGLWGALLQIFRDEAKYLKEKEIKQKELSYVIGASSHMANTAFDKHIEFCEDYIRTLNNKIDKVVEEGPSDAAGKLSSELAEVRIKHSAWVTKEIRNKLLPFEKALRSMWAKNASAKFYDDDTSKSKVMVEAYDIFMSILTSENEEQKEHSISAAVDSLQNLLGIKELTNLRMKIIKEANKAVG